MRRLAVMCLVTAEEGEKRGTDGQREQSALLPDLNFRMVRELSGPIPLAQSFLTCILLLEASLRVRCGLRSTALRHPRCAYGQRVL